jgi:hypothetical protein
MTTEQPATRPAEADSSSRVGHSSSPDRHTHLGLGAYYAEGLNRGVRHPLPSTYEWASRRSR